MDSSQHAPGSQCLLCGYDLSGVPLGPCPECGADMSASQAEAMRFREAHAKEDLANARVWSVNGWPLLTVFYAIACGLVSMNLGWGIVALVLGGIEITLGAFLLTSFRGRVPKHQRRIAGALLANRIVLLHVPWLISPVAAAVSGVIAGLLKHVDMARIVVAGLVFGVCAAWCYACIKALALFGQLLRRDTDLRGVPVSTAAATVLGLGGALVWLLGAVIAVLTSIPMAVECADWISRMIWPLPR